jgi:3-hydroxyacyl-[acyl-carrier-protein] dehydratase
MLDIEQIRDILPHRRPMLFVDRVLELIPHKSCTAIKAVSVVDCIGPGPNGTKVFPSSLLIEAMAQIGGMPMHREDKTPAFLAGMDKFTFERQVYPGDVLRMEGRVIWERNTLFKVHVQACTDAGQVATGIIIYTVGTFADRLVDDSPTSS